MDRGRRLDSLLPLLRRRALERNPLLRARRHGRQSADEPGPRVARGPGLVRPSPVPAESPHWRQHPLVTVRRPADRRHHPCPPPVRRRSGGGTRRGRHRADAAAAPAALLAGDDRTAAHRPPRLSARLRCLVLRRIGGRNVHAHADRSSRLAACLARARGCRNGRPETRARRRSDGHRVGHVAVDRPGNADLPRDHGRGSDPVLGDRRRSAAANVAYAVALGGGTAIGFLLFASYANRLPICDALSPVWFSDAVLGGALLFGAALLSPADWKHRLALAAGAEIAVVSFHGLAWPQCLSRPEGVSQEVVDLWLSHVREARPIYRHGWRTVLAIVSLPLTGLIGWLLLVWFNRRDPDKLRRTLAATAPLAAAMLLLLWQTRTGPAAQILSATGDGPSLDQRSLGPEIEECRSADFRHGRARSARHGRGSTFASNFFPKEKRCRDASRRQGEPPVRVALGTETCRPAAEGHGVHVRGPRPEADHRHAS